MNIMIKPYATEKILKTLDERVGQLDAVTYGCSKQLSVLYFTKMKRQGRGNRGNE